MIGSTLIISGGTFGRHFVCQNIVTKRQNHDYPFFANI